jgi:hypothetical protein
MNPLVKMLLDSLIKYLTAHPDQLDVLIESLINTFVQGQQKQG